jgi:hypothetical protein
MGSPALLGFYARAEAGGEMFAVEGLAEGEELGSNVL